MRLFLSIVLAAALIAVPSRAQQTKEVRKTTSTGNLLEGFNTAQTHNFLNGAQVTFAAGSIVTISGTLNGVPTGGTLDLTNVTVLGLPGGGDAVTAGTLDQFANVTQTAGMTLAITGNTTLGGGSHSGTNTGDQNIVLSGDVTGSGTGPITTTLSNSGVTAGSYGNSTTVPAVTVNSKGQVTSVSNVTITGGSGNVIKGTPFADGQLLYISNATTGEVTGIAGATFTPGNNTIGFNGTISSTGFAPTAITGATGPLQVWIGNSVTGNFTKGNLVEGNGIALTKGANDITVAAVATGTNTGDQNTFVTIKASGQSDITAGSTTANFTVAGAGGITIETTPGTNTVTINGSGISAGATPDGHSILLETANLGSLSSGFFISGNFGTAADVLGNYTVVTKAYGTVATPTASPTPGAIPDGTTITFSSTTPSLTNFRSTTNGTDPTYTVGTAGNSVVLSGDTTYEVVANKAGWITSAVASFAYTVDPVPTHSGAWTIAADGDTHTLVFSEAITFGAGGSGGFVANMSGGAVNLTYSSGSGTTSIVFTGNRTVESSETQTGDNGAYTQPGNGAEDSAGQDVVTFTGHTITNDSEAGGGGATAADTFNRANENPMSTLTMSDGTSTWQTSQSAATVDWQILTNQVLPVSGAITIKRVASPTFASNQWAEITLVSGNTVQVGPAVRIQSDSDADCYVAYCNNSNEIVIYRVADTGTLGYTSIVSSGTGLTLSAGDVIRLEANGTTLTAYQNGVQRAQGTDATHSGGQPGLYTGVTTDTFNASDL